MCNVLSLAKRRVGIEILSVPIDLGDVLYVIEVARNAPSRANKQPWRSIVKVKWANELLGVPEECILQTIIPVGRAKEPHKTRERLRLDDIVYCNRWGRDPSPASNMDSNDCHCRLSGFPPTISKSAVYGAIDRCRRCLP